MIKEQIYNYSKAREKGISFKKFLSSFVKEVKKDLMPNTITFTTMEKIIDRIYTALIQNEKIIIVGDYDVDGITSSAILFKSLKKLGFDVDVILPDRFLNGYGLSVNLVDIAVEKEGKLLITVDNGINAIDSIDYAESKGLDVIITDHHLPNDEKWKNKALVMNPHCIDNNLVNKNVCGAYVSLVLSLNLLKENWANCKSTEFICELYELASIGTIADCMPITDENQALLFFTQNQLWKRGIVYNKGIKSLINTLGKFALNELNQDNIGFYLSPCLNASGRLQKADLSFKLITESDNKEIVIDSAKLASLNVRRQQITSKISEWIKNEIDSNASVQVIQIANNFNEYSNRELEGVIGLVAQKCVDLSNCPSLIFIDNKFSARSTEDVNLHKLIGLAKVNSLSYGGHKEACGGKINYSIDAIEFKQKLNENYELSRSEEIHKMIRIPQDINLDEVYQAVESLKPCDVLPDLLIEEIEGKAFSIMAQKHFYFYSNIGSNNSVKIVKFNDSLKLRNTNFFRIKRLIFKPTKGLTNKVELIAQKIII